MTVEELKSEAAKLPAIVRLKFAEWIGQDREVRRIHKSDLARGIMIGLEQLERGEYAECSSEAQLRTFLEGVKARGRERLRRLASPDLSAKF
jgi:hypothetical protein